MVGIAIAGVTAGGNMGGVAMLATTLEQMSERVPGARFSLLSIAPGADRSVEDFEGLEIVSAPPLLLMGVYLPLALVFWPAWRRHRLRNALGWIPYFRTLRECDVLLDLSGIAFVDGRGPLLLLYNAAVFLPALALGLKVVKLSQALGPFETRTNRWVAGFCLRKCSAVIARGRLSHQSLVQLGVANARMLPDVTFCLRISERLRQQALDSLAKRGIGRDLIVVSPSEVVRRYLDRTGRSYVAVLIDLVRELSARGLDTVILPHSFGNAGSKNNDVDLCREIHRSLGTGASNVWLIDDVRDPRRLRALIGNARAFVGSRFHSVVGALAMGVPSLTIGWSHKYREMAAMLEVEEFVLDYAEVDSATLIARLDALLDCEQAVRERIAMALESVRRDAAANFDVALSVLRSS